MTIDHTAKAEFEKLVKANMKRAYYTALGILGSHDAAMEISQEAFIRVYRNFDKYDRQKNFFTWYYKILKISALIL
jgi:RNA polymerase sigma-70 factor (ECF subfamily)